MRTHHQGNLDQLSIYFFLKMIILIKLQTSVYNPAGQVLKCKL